MLQNDISGDPLLNPMRHRGIRSHALVAPLPPASANFLTIATANLQRGFRFLTPINPADKRPCIKGWQKRKPTTKEQIQEWATKFPFHNVGVVCQLGMGKDIVLDADTDGLVEQIENESGHKLPVTYSVATRPQSAPWKRHYYFKQTEYSLKHLRNNINASDVGQRYDVKVNGGQVVAAGSIHKDTGLPYEVVNDVKPAPIPDWLVDWLVADKARLAPDKHAHATARPRIPYSEFATQQKMFVPIKPARHYKADELIREGDRWEALRQKAGTLARSSFPRPEIFNALLGFARTRCFDGESYIKTNRQKIYDLAYSPSLRIGDVYLKSSAKSSSILLHRRLSRHELLVAALRTFPDATSMDEGYSRLSEVLQGTDYTLHRSKPADQQAVYRARREAGLEVRGKHWHRIPSGNKT